MGTGGVADWIWSDTKTQHPLSTHSSTSQHSAEFSISTFSSSRQIEDTIWSRRVTFSVIRVISRFSSFSKLTMAIED